jgi:hypothetical protein
MTDLPSLQDSGHGWGPGSPGLTPWAKSDVPSGLRFRVDSAGIALAHPPANACTPSGVFQESTYIHQVLKGP